MSALPSIKSNSGLIQLGNNATATQNLSIDSSPLTSSLPAQIYLGKDGVSSVAVASISTTGVITPSTGLGKPPALAGSFYEEGTWTPGIGSGVTGSWSSSVGYYTKIGRLVTINGRAVATTNTSCTANGQLITGLPFVVANLGSNYPQGSVMSSGSTIQSGIYGAQNSTTVNAVQAIAATLTLDFSLTYTTTA